MLFVVTGGAGFIGSTIATALVGRGDSVRIFDDFSSGKEENIPSGAEVIQGSITDTAALGSVFKGAQGIFHCAALPRVQESIDYPRETHEVNITGTLNVFLEAKNAGVRRVVYSASSAAYGDQPIMPMHEDMRPDPKSPYGLQKYVGEHYARLAHLFWGIETVSLRYFNAYGPRMTMAGAYCTVIAVFLKQKAAGGPLTITGDGTQTRDFVYIDDIVRANLLAMDSKKVGTGEVINIGTATSQSVNEVAALMGGPIEHVPPRVEPRATLADITRARTLLDWEPSISFHDGLRQTMAWYEHEERV